ncbi:MAG: membrane integrity-associated transporter subunit PqiC [Betaproteobacteria bacterium]|nr:membrane integrity-associated transporter subunit PqiC [Betaproteobacteria bacterium]
MKKLSIISLALLLAACSLGPASKDAPATYDLGAPRAHAANQPRIRASLLVHNVAAPGWLDTPAIVYRLNYQDAARQQIYASSRWAAAPAALLTQRLRGRLAAASDGGVIGVADSARADYTLRLELEDFSQVFDAADASRAVVIARASIVNVARRSLLAQTSFTVERAAASANAEGGVRALAAAGDELIEAVVAWAAASLAREKKGN